MILSGDVIIFGRKVWAIMKKSHLVSLLLILTLFVGVLIWMSQSPEREVFAQASYQTPTPNAEGQIIYTVQEGDNCTRIFLLTGVSIDQIIALNNLGEDCSVFPSQPLILGTVAPATATPRGPVPTATIGPPTPTPFDGNGEICVVLFEDLDGNQMRSENEFYLAGGVVSVSNRVGTFSETRETIGGDPALVDPVCFEDVPEGEYNLSMGIPAGYNATTGLNIAISLTAGDTVVVDFGAQTGAEMISPEASATGGGRSPLLLVIGLFFLAGGGGLAFFFIRSRMKS